MFFTPLILSILVVVCIVSLVRYIERSSRDLAHFLLTLREGAFMDVVQSGKENQFSDALKEVTREFARVSLEKELHYQYLKTLNENIGVGIISLSANGKVKMINPAAKNILNVSQLESLAELQRVDEHLYQTLITLPPERKEVVKVYIEDQALQLSVQMKEMSIQNESVKIYLLQNLNEELDRKEIEAWQQLTRVLTHEIMNSVTPITSLSKAIKSILLTDGGELKATVQLSRENIEDIESGLSTIASRSEGLLKFVNRYKQFSKVPVLKLETIDIGFVLQRIVTLLTPDLIQKGITLQLQGVDKPLSVRIDVSLMEQSFINILKNAIEAVPEDGTGSITVTLRKKLNSGISVVIADNGPGMEQEVLSRIFIPFYTTKSAGTGVGLSLSRQILKLHNGTIRVQSAPGEGSIFFIEWT